MILIRAALVLFLSLAPVFADAPLIVEIVTAESRADSQSISLTGEINARDTLSASFPMSGRVADVLVQEGDKVTKGFPLAHMESVQQEQALRAAEAGLATAQADHRQAIEDLDRQNALLERGATTRISRDSTEDALRIAEGGLAQALSELDRANKALTETVLIAPTDATVIDRIAEPGQVVGAAQPIIELALGDKIDAVFEVPEVLLTDDGPPPVVYLSLIETPGEQFTGEVREISPLIDPATGTVEVTVAVKSPPENMSYGDAVRGTATKQNPAHVVLPYTAMSATKDGPAVWVVDPNTMVVELKPIRIARFETGQIILADGIESGTLVVTRGAQLLYPGRIVKRTEANQ